MTFLPKSYEQPKTSSNYFRFQEGQNKFRILGSAVIGYEFFNNDNKPVRSKEPFESTPNIKKDGKVKHFWAFPVYNYDEKKVQIMELTQSSIQKAIKSLIDNKKWGSPMMYDLCITKVGEGLETEYSVMPEPPIAEPSDEIKNAFMEKPINLEALFSGDDPFAN